MFRNSAQCGLLVKKTRFVFFLSFIFLNLAACRHHDVLVEHYQNIRGPMLAGDFAAAARMEESSRKDVYKEIDSVMYWLNAGTLQHYANAPKISMEHFIHAESRMQELWTKSISSEATKFIVSETVQPYPGEDYERILVYLYTSLNRILEGRTKDAIVEARRADEFLKKMRIFYEKKDSLGTTYTQDAFMLWLVGLFYELEGSYSDALLAYKAAHTSFSRIYTPEYGVPAPSFLVEDGARAARLLSQPDEERYFKNHGARGDTVEQLAEGKAEIVVFHGNGEAPHKRELAFYGPMPDGYLARLTLPELVGRTPVVSYSTVETSEVRTRSVLVEPIQGIATKNFQHRLPAIKARMIARAVTKYVATKGVQAAVSGGSKDAGRQIAGLLVGVLGNVAAAVSEAADLRVWNTLPAQIQVARLWVIPGEHMVKIRFKDAAGRDVGVVERTVNVKAGERKLLSVRSIL